MREFDSQALRNLRQILGTSTGPPQFVDLQDELIQQGLNLNPIIRRGNALGTGGLFTASILNTHAGSDTQTTQVDVYDPATTFLSSRYEIPDETDLWIVSWFARALTGLADFGGGKLGLLYSGDVMGWRNQGGQTSVEHVLATFDEERVVGTVSVLLMTDGWSPYPVRVIRGPVSSDTLLQFQTVKSGAGAGTYRVDLILGAFPAGLGQDILGIGTEAG